MITELPAPRTPDPMAAPPLRWGVLGTGWIAERFVASLQQHTRQQVVAVGSRTVEQGRAFAERFNLPSHHGSYEDLVADDQVHVVYVATPHTAHFADAIMAIDYGRHVLVEKPLALNVAQATEIAERARARKVFCAEALWTFFLPRFDVVRQLLEAGALGEVRTVIADHGEHFSADHRIQRADLAGGPVLDLATYPVSLAVEVLGSPATVQASAQPAPSGVTGQVSAVLSTAAGDQAVLHSTILSTTPSAATIAGTDATLELAGPFHSPGPLRLVPTDGSEPLTYDEPAIGHDALHFEAADVARQIAAGHTETSIRPLAASIETLRVLDEIRSQIGEHYPADRHITAHH